MSQSTNFPSGYPFYGGITTEYGTGIHEDYDPVTSMAEPMRAEYLNNIENRMAQVEHIVNQMEHFILYPDGYINPILDTTSPPASGTYYVDSNYSILASGVNMLIQLLGEASVIDTSNIPGYPFTVI